MLKEGGGNNKHFSKDQDEIIIQDQLIIH